MTKIFRRCAAGLLLAAGAAAFAGDFSVNPIRLEIGASAKSGVIGIRNESKEKLSVQLQAMEWTQDAAGQDAYSETQNLVFFPKMMTVESGEEGLIRVGSRTPVAATEKTYRLFIEELPGSIKTPKAAAPRSTC